MSSVDYPSVRLSCISTPDAEPMLIRFLSGVEDGIAVTCHALDLSGGRGLGGGERLWKYKTQLLIDACDVGTDDFEIFSDIDITVYRPFRRELPALMDGYDICFQREWCWESRQANIGFIVFRRSPAVRNFWKEVLEKVQEDGIWDQEAVNLLLRDDAFLLRIGVKVGLLPCAFWAFSQGTLPMNACILHHANCASKIERKWLQMNTYRSLFVGSKAAHRVAFDAAVRHLTNCTWHCGELDRRTLLGEIGIDDAGVVRVHKGKVDAQQVTVTADCLVMHRQGEKLLAICDEFYLDAHRGRVVCVGRLCLKDFQASRVRYGFFFMYAILD